jgi:hypothetical protein
MYARRYAAGSSMSRTVSLSAVADAERRKKEVLVYCSSFESLFSIIVKAFSSATSAMQVVIGDDLQAFIGNAKKQGSCKAMTYRLRTSRHSRAATSTVMTTCWTPFSGTSGKVESAAMG